MFTKYMRIQVLGSIAALAILTGASSITFAQNAQAIPADVEVLARGPIHEAFAEPVDGKPQAFPMVSKQPPDPIPELPPDQKPEGQNVQWVPGYFAWDDERSDYIWISGFWRVPPPGRQWVPGQWQKVGEGWQWSPGYWNVEGRANVEYLPPPPAPLEVAPSVPAPSDTSMYVPGTWVYRAPRYVWRPGFWLAYRSNWVWVPAHYLWTPCGYIFVDGHWDYALRDRGVLFAPVYVPRRVVVAGWRYTPSFVVYDDFLMGSLFVRPGYGHYYFGDYFEARYSGLGFVAWFDFRIGGHSYDPLFVYYRHHFDADRNWERNMRSLYADRRSGTVPRPPRTLAQQHTLIEDITVKKTVKIGDVKTVTALAPLGKVDPKFVKFEPVNKAQHAQEQKEAERLRELASHRREVETKLLSEGPAKHSEPPKSIKLDLPTPSTTFRSSPDVKVVSPPPLPEAVRRESPAVIKKDTTPPLKELITPPPPKKDATPSTPPPPPKKDVTPPAPPPPPKKDPTPPKKEGSSPKKGTSSTKVIDHPR